MRSSVSETSHWRLNALGVIFATIALVVIGQMLRIRVSPEAQKFKAIGQANEGDWKHIVPARGIIYDRWGNVLAGNITVYEAGAELRDVKNPETIALTLMGVAHADYNQILSLASIPASDDPKNPAVYSVLADYLTEDQKNQIEKLQADLEANPGKGTKDRPAPSLSGLVFTPHLVRSYPEKDVASNILGFVNREGQGYFGIESKFNDLMTGTPQTVWVPRDPNKAGDLPEVPPGASLILTISREIQSMVESTLDKAVESTGSTGGTILVMDPRTGEILALASTPRMDLNQYWDYSKVYTGSTPFNKGVSQAYEPGSVFKVLTMAAAFDAGEVNPDTPFLDTGTIEIGGIYIYNWNGGAWGPQTMLGCMQHSLNVCLTWVAKKLGPTRFYQYMQAFGIGRLTGIDLSGENPGRLKLPGDNDWYEADLGTNSFGQGVAATPVQMGMAISAVANDGKMMAPHILKAMVDNGRQYNTPPQVVGMPISKDAANSLSEMLAVSLETEGSDALVDGYRLAGKTGTAEIPTPGGYSTSQTNASFVGWGPVDDPKFLVYIWLEKPSTSQWGSVVAAPVFHDVVKQLVILMNIPPDNIRLSMSGAGGH